MMMIDLSLGRILVRIHILDFDRDGSDIIDLSAHDLKFKDLKIKYDDGDAIITKIPGGQITLENVAINSLSKSDFDF